MLQPYNMSSNWVKGLLDFSLLPLLKEKTNQQVYYQKMRIYGSMCQNIPISSTSKRSNLGPSQKPKREREIYNASCGLGTPVYSIASYLLFISKCLKHLLSLLRGEMSSVQVWLVRWRIPASRENEPGLESWNHLVPTSGVGNYTSPKWTVVYISLMIRSLSLGKTLCISNKHYKYYMASLSISFQGNDTDFHFIIKMGAGGKVKSGCNKKKQHWEVKNSPRF